ncbi:unnamed protein product [Adineta steineri]|uniref:Thioredoxin domain-containing protein n=1 Tax=Adineta steineri TaxID=433720 RepID=A0A818NF27_9BILA|nr:unnamed protein product [Adineta steineri]CAF3604180.1 unnamed protein product [Adineta steineri]
MTTDVASLAQFNNIQANVSPKTELIVLFFFDRRHEDCERIERYVNLWSEDDDYINRVLIIKCNKQSCNPDIFEKYNVKAIPIFLFIKNNKQVAPPSTESFDKIEAIINGLLGIEN